MSLGEEASSPVGSDKPSSQAEHVWTPLVGLCSISCGKGENRRPFVCETLLLLLSTHTLSRSVLKKGWLPESQTM